MSKIVELIKQKCPDGVEYKKLGTLCEKIKNVVWDEETKYYIDLSAVSIELHSILENGIVQITKDSAPSRAKQVVKSKDILFGGTRPMQGRICILPNKYEGYIASTGFNIVRIKDKAVLNKYVYHCMNSRDFYDFVESVQHGASYPAINDSEMKEYEIPVPPLEIQKEIVRILDKFTELEVGLQAELDARKKQYEYYRDNLMIFDENVVEWKRVDEIFTFIRNGFVGKVTSFFTNEENGIRYLEGTNIHNGIISDNENLYVTNEFHQKHIRNELKTDDILMVQSGHIGECAVVGKKYEGANCHALIIMSNGGEVLSKFYVHYFHSFKGFRSLTPAITGGTIKHILAGKIGNIKVPVPTIEKQKEIVEVLDKFEQYCFDKHIGLPAEIEARHKQYEYYRDKLLTFERKVV